MNELKKANDLLHSTQNQKARSLLSHISTCVYIEDAELLKDEMERANNYNEITEDEYKALTTIFNNLQAGDRLSFMTTPVKIFSKRLWEINDLQKITQFRNCVTDMLMLGFLSFEEYIDLSNEVDKYIKYTFSNGGLK